MEYVNGVVSETEVVGFDAVLTIVRVRDRDRDPGRRDVDGCGVYGFGDPHLQTLWNGLCVPGGIGHDLAEKFLSPLGCAKICAENGLDESFDGHPEYLAAVHDSGH